MSQNITNKAQIKYNNETMPPTCPVVTRVEPGLVAHKYATTDKGRIISVHEEGAASGSGSGTVGESRKITYDILLVNHSSKDFTNVKITDTIGLSNNVDTNEISYVRAESSGDNEGTLPNIIMTVPLLKKESEMVVYYTIQLSDAVPVKTDIDNYAEVTYNENPLNVEGGEQAKVPTDIITITLDYSATTVVSEKTASAETVLCGEKFDYDLTFTNSGDNDATGVEITDFLPKDFMIERIVVTNDGDTLTQDTDFVVTDSGVGTDDRTIVIKNKTLIPDHPENESLSIAPGKVLTVKITGKFPCS